jgi:hypothetical protein
MLKCKGTNQSQTILTNMSIEQAKSSKKSKTEKEIEKREKAQRVEASKSSSPEVQAINEQEKEAQIQLDLIESKERLAATQLKLEQARNKPQKEAEENQKKLDAKKAEEESEAAKAEAKAEADRQSDLKKRISLSSYAALKATGPNLHTDTTHKYLKKGWLGQAFDVAESKFQRLREATFGSITTAKETYQHRIARDHSMVATYEARFNDIKRSYIQAFEEMTGKKYTDLQNLTEAEIQKLDFDNENLDPKMKKAYKSIQSPEILLKKISRVEDVLAQINAPEIAEIKEGKKDVHGNILMNPDDSPIEDIVIVEGKPSLMEIAKDKSFKPQSKQDSKLISHKFYKLLDVCENELLKLSNFEKAQTVTNLATGVTALVRAKFQPRQEAVEPTSSPENTTNPEQLTQRQLMMMDLFGNKFQFQVQSFGYNNNGDVLFMMVKNKKGNIEQIMLNRTLTLDEQAIISQIKAGLVEVGNTVEYKNYDLHYTSKNSTSSKPEFSPIITPTPQNTPPPEEQNNIISNPNDIEKYKANIENGDMDYLVDKFFTEHTPSTLNGIQSSTKDNVLYDIQVKMDGTEEYKYLAITMDDANTKDHSLFNQLKQIKNSDPSIIITIKNGRIDLEAPQSQEPSLISSINSEPAEQKKINPLNSSAAVKSNMIEKPNLSNTIENEKLSEPEIESQTSIPAVKVEQSAQNALEQVNEGFPTSETNTNVNKKKEKLVEDYTNYTDPNLLFEDFFKNNPEFKITEFDLKNNVIKTKELKNQIQLKISNEMTKYLTVVNNFRRFKLNGNLYNDNTPVTEPLLYKEMQELLNQLEEYKRKQDLFNFQSETVLNIKSLLQIKENFNNKFNSMFFDLKAGIEYNLKFNETTKSFSIIHYDTNLNLINDKNLNNSLSTLDLTNFINFINSNNLIFKIGIDKIEFYNKEGVLINRIKKN